MCSIPPENGPTYFIGYTTFCEGTQKDWAWFLGEFLYTTFTLLPSSTLLHWSETRPTEMWWACWLWLYNSPLSRPWWWLAGEWLSEDRIILSQKMVCIYYIYIYKMCKYNSFQYKIILISYMQFKSKKNWWTCCVQMSSKFHFFTPKFRGK